MQDLRKLVPLDEYNQRIRNRPSNSHTGIECPNCGEELQDTNPGVYMLSSPMQSDVKCFGCGFTSRRYVDK